MKSFLLILAALTMLTSSAFAGSIISQTRATPIDAKSRAFYYAYDIIVERQYANPYQGFYTMTFFPTFVCNNPMNCPRPVMPRPSYLIIDGTYYDTCNGFVQHGHSNNTASPIRIASLADNYSWSCAFPPLSQSTARIERWDGSVEQLVGFRIR